MNLYTKARSETNSYDNKFMKGDFMKELTTARINDLSGEGVSVITCTNRPLFLNNVLENYKRQFYNPKELIIILNNNDFDKNEVKKSAGCEAVKVYQPDEGLSLGSCYNFAIKQCQYDYVAKFDDDDYYAPLHLSESMRAFTYSEADLVGKHARFIYFERDSLLMLYKGIAYNYSNYIVGATMVFKRNVWEMINFKDQTLGEDSCFQEECLKHGFQIFAIDEYNYVTIRRKDSSTHTFKMDDNSYMKHCELVAKTLDYVPLITPSITF